MLTQSCSYVNALLMECVINSEHCIVWFIVIINDEVEEEETEATFQQCT